MAIYLLILLGAAVLMSVVFARRAFCSYLCPIGHLLGLYSCVSPPAWRAKSPAVCDDCKTEDCIDPARLTRLTGRSCASGLFPRDLAPSRDCLMCTQCLKSCPTGNLRLSLRKPFSGLFSTIDLRSAEVAFLLLVVGFLLYDIVPEVPAGKTALMWLPRRLVESVSAGGLAADLLTGAVLFIAYPAALLLAVVVPARLLSKASSGQLAKAFALLLLPTVACVHAVKGIFKAVSRVPYVPHAFSEPHGMATANGIIDKTVSVDKSILNTLEPPTSYLGAAVLLIVLVVTFRLYARSADLASLSHRAKLPLLLGTLAVWASLALTIWLWRF